MTGDLFDFSEPPAPSEPHVFTVSELTSTVRAVLEEQVGQVWVEGEISNYRKQASGHQYFTLKDAGSQLPCVLFMRAGAWRKNPPLSDGMHVQLRGNLTVYEARGQYQLNVQLVQAGGAGLLQAKFEALKRKLEAEGLFDPDRKRELPQFPTAIAIVTSATGAALRDMLNILSRRAPWVRVVVSNVRVQGDGAAEEVAYAIDELNRLAETGVLPVDLIVVARGGGSVEDLWAFNEEVVARAISTSDLPVVSAIGHEIDFTIADFAADVRAPTPSAAAELIVPDQAELSRRLGDLRERFDRHVSRVLEQARAIVELLKHSEIFRAPGDRLRESAQQLDSIAEEMTQSVRGRLHALRLELAEAAGSLRMHRPDQALALFRQRLEGLREQISERFRHDLEQRRNSLDRLADALKLLSPEATLARGYSLTTTSEGALLRSAGEVQTGQEILTRMSDGTFASKVLASGGGKRRRTKAAE